MTLLSIVEWAKGAEMYVFCGFFSSILLVCIFGMMLFIDVHYTNKEQKMLTTSKRETVFKSKWKFFLIGLFCVSQNVNAQIRVPKAGDAWDLKVDSALLLIAKTDSDKYIRLIDVCNGVDFWISNYSSNNVTHDGNTIYIAVEDMKLNSINNIACILVHESMHLYYTLHPSNQSENEEEFKCYLYELSFANKLENIEPWLLEHIHRHIKQ